MWNNIKNFFAGFNWKALLLAWVAQWLFAFVFWGLFWSGLMGWSVPAILRMLVDFVVFIVAYVWAAQHFPLRRIYR